MAENKVDYIIRLLPDDSELKRKIKASSILNTSDISDIKNLIIDEIKKATSAVNKEAPKLKDGIERGLDIDTSDLKKKLEFISGLMHELEEISPMENWAKRGKSVYDTFVNLQHSVSALSKDVKGFQDSLNNLTSSFESFKSSYQSFKPTQFAETAKAVGNVVTEMGNVVAVSTKVDAALQKSYDDAKKLKEEFKSITEEDFSKIFNVSTRGGLESAMNELKRLEDEMEKARTKWDKTGNINDIIDFAPSIIKFKKLSKFIQSNRDKLSVTSNVEMPFDPEELGSDGKSAADIYINSILQDMNSKQSDLDKAINKYVDSVKQQIDNAIKSSGKDSSSNALLNQLKEVKLSLHIPKESEIRDKINAVVDSLNANPEKLHTINVGIDPKALDDSVNIIEDKTKRAYGKNNKGSNDVITDSLVEKTDKRFIRLAQTIGKKQKGILNNTEKWREKMIKALKIGLNDVDINFGVKGQNTVSLDNLYNTLQNYFDVNEIDIHINKENFAKEIQDAINENGIAFGSSGGQVSIDPKDIATAVYSGVQAAITGKAPIIQQSNFESVSEETSDSIENTTESSKEYVKELNETSVNIDRVIASLRKFAEIATKTKTDANGNIISDAPKAMRVASLWLKGIDLSEIANGASDSDIIKMIQESWMSKDESGYSKGSAIGSLLTGEDNLKRFGFNLNPKSFKQGFGNTAADITYQLGKEIAELFDRNDIESELVQEKTNRIKNVELFNSVRGYGKSLGMLNNIRNTRKIVTEDDINEFLDRPEAKEYFEQIEEKIKKLLNKKKSNGNKLDKNEELELAELQRRSNNQNFPNAFSEYKNAISKFGGATDEESIAKLNEAKEIFHEITKDIYTFLNSKWGNTKGDVTIEGRSSVLHVNTPNNLINLPDDAVIKNVDLNESFNKVYSGDNKEYGREKKAQNRLGDGRNNPILSEKKQQPTDSKLLKLEATPFTTIEDQNKALVISKKQRENIVKEAKIKLEQAESEIKEKEIELESIKQQIKKIQSNTKRSRTSINKMSQTTDKVDDKELQSVLKEQRLRLDVAQKLSQGKDIQNIEEISKIYPDIADKLSSINDIVKYREELQKRLKVIESITVEEAQKRLKREGGSPEFIKLYEDFVNNPEDARKDLNDRISHINNAEQQRRSTLSNWGKSEYAKLTETSSSEITKVAKPIIEKLKSQIKKYYDDAVDIVSQIEDKNTSPQKRSSLTNNLKITLKLLQEIQSQYDELQGKIGGDKDLLNASRRKNINNIISKYPIDNSSSIEKRKSNIAKNNGELSDLEIKKKQIENDIQIAQNKKGVAERNISGIPGVKEDPKIKFAEKYNKLLEQETQLLIKIDNLKNKGKDTSKEYEKLDKIHTDMQALLDKNEDKNQRRIYALEKAEKSEIELYNAYKKRSALQHDLEYISEAENEFNKYPNFSGNVGRKSLRSYKRELTKQFKTERTSQYIGDSTDPEVISAAYKQAQLDADEFYKNLIVENGKLLLKSVVVNPDDGSTSEITQVIDETVKQTLLERLHLVGKKSVDNKELEGIDDVISRIKIAKSQAMLYGGLSQDDIDNSDIVKRQKKLLDEIESLETKKSKLQAEIDKFQETDAAKEIKNKEEEIDRLKGSIKGKDKDDEETKVVNDRVKQLRSEIKSLSKDITPKEKQLKLYDKEIEQKLAYINNGELQKEQRAQEKINNAKSPEEKLISATEILTKKKEQLLKIEEQIAQLKEKYDDAKGTKNEESALYALDKAKKRKSKLEDSVAAIQNNIPGLEKRVRKSTPKNEIQSINNVDSGLGNVGNYIVSAFREGLSGTPLNIDTSELAQEETLKLVLKALGGKKISANSPEEFIEQISMVVDGLTDRVDKIDGETPSKKSTKKSAKKKKEEIKLESEAAEVDEYAINSWLKKLNTAKFNINEAKSNKFISKEDELLFTKQLDNINKLVDGVKEGTVSYEDLEKASRKAISTANTLLKSFNKNAGINAKKNADTQYNKISGLLGMEELSEDSPSKIVSDYVRQYNKLQSTFNAAKKKGTLNTSDTQNVLVQQAAHVQTLSRNLTKAITKSEKLRQSVEQTGTYTDRLGNEKELGGSTQMRIEDVKNMETTMRSYVQNTLGQGAIENVRFDATNQRLLYTFRTGKNTVADMAVEYDNVTESLNAYQLKERESLTGLDAFMNGLKAKSKAILQYIMSMTSLYRVFSMLRQGVQYVKDIDAALIELKKVTDETERTYDKFLETASKTASKIGSTIKDFTQATAEFARLGYNIKQASEMAEAAIVYTNVGDGIASVSEASESIISTIKAFNMEANESMEIVSRFNEVGNNFAITSKGIGDALQKSASALFEAGNTIDESIGLITAANSVVQDPEAVGTALKTLSLRVRGTKTELEEAGLETDNMAESTSALQKKLLALTGGKVDIMLDADTFKSTTQILREMSAVWGEMTDIQRASALELMGGKRQANILSALIQNFDVAEDAIESSLNSEGSALAENEKYLDSIKGKMDLFTNSIQTMWNNFIDSDVIKFIVDLGTKTVQFIDKINPITAILGGLLFYFTAIKKQNPINIIQDIGEKFTNAGLQATQYGRSLTGLSLEKQALTMASKGATQAQITEQLVSRNGIEQDKAKLISEQAITAAKMKQNGVTAKQILSENIENKLSLSTNAINWLEAQGTELLTKAKLKQAFTNGVLTKSDYIQIGAKYGLLTATEALKLGIKGLTATIKASMASNPIGWIMLVISAVISLVMWLKNLKSKTEKLAEKLDDLKAELKDIQSELESVNSKLETTQDRMAELLAMDSLTFVEEEELKNLQKVNEELEREKRLLEAKEERAKKRTAEAASETVNSRLSDKEYQGNFVSSLKAGLEGAVAGAIGGAAAGLVTGGALSPLGALIGGIGGAITGVGTEHASNRKSVKDVLDEKINNYNTLLEEQNKIEDKIENEEKIINGDGYTKKQKKKAEKTKKGLEKDLTKKKEEISNTTTYIDDTLSQLEADLSDVDYGYGADELLNTVGNFRNSWEIKSGTNPNAKQDAIDQVLDRQPFENITNALDDYSQQFKKGTINAKQFEAEIKKIYDNNLDFQNNLKDSGITLDDLTNSLTHLGSSAKKSIESITETYQKGVSALSNYKGNVSDVIAEYKNLDGTIEQITWGSLFDENGNTIDTQISKAMQGADEDVRNEFARIVKLVNEGNMKVETAMQSFGISGALAGYKFLESSITELNGKIFKDLGDDVSGLIDTFEEFGLALESVAKSIDLVNQAEAEMQNSGRVSIETALQLMTSTDNWNELLEIENGNITLVDGAMDALAQTKLNQVKTNLKLALSEVRAQLEQINLAQSSDDLSTTIEESTTESVRQLSANMEYLSSIINDFLSWNWGGMTKRATEAKNNSLKSTEITKVEPTVSKSDLEEKEKNILAQLEMLDGVNVENFNQYYDSGEISGGSSTKADAQKSQYERSLEYRKQQAEQIQNEIDLLEEKGKVVNEGYYVALKDNALLQQGLIKAEKARLTALLNGQAKGTESYNETAEALNEIESELDAVIISVEQFNNAIQDLHWDNFDKMLGQIDSINSEISDVIELVGDEKLVNDDGNWTEKGITSLGLYVQQMETAAVTAKQYGEEIEELNATWKESGYSEQEYKEKLADLTSQQYDSIDAYENAKDAIVDLNQARVDAIKNGIEKEIDAYQDYIDVVKESLDAERDLYEFKKDISKRTKDIASIERRIASLSGSTNKSDIAERRKLQAELFDAKSELDDSYYDRAKDAQSDALDKEASAFEESRQKYMDDLDKMLEDTEVLIAKSIQDAILNADIISEELSATESKYGINVSNYIKQPWIDGAAQATAWKDTIAKETGLAEDIISVFNTNVDIILNGADGDSSAWDIAKSKATAYATYVGGNNFTLNSYLTSLPSIIKTNIIDPWDTATKSVEAYEEASRRAANAANSVESTEYVPTKKDPIKEQPSWATRTRSTEDVKALQTYLNTYFGENLSVDGSYGAQTAAAVTRMQSKLGVTADGDFGANTAQALGKYVENKAQSYITNNNMREGDRSRWGQDPRFRAIIEEMNYLTKNSLSSSGNLANIKGRTTGYAKGTIGTLKDQFAVTDEYGPELTLVPGKNGNLSFMRAGTGVIPADMTKRLFELALMPANELGNNIIKATIPNIAMNDTSVNVNFDALVKADNITNDVVPEVERLVSKQLDIFVKKLNYSIKSVGGR